MEGVVQIWPKDLGGKAQDQIGAGSSTLLH